MLHLLRRHPIPVRAAFDFTLALTFAVPQEPLRRMLLPGLTLDTYGEHGFVAVAMVATRHMRPAFFPPHLGRDFFLIGYRIFVRCRTASGRRLRGLQILRSDTDRRAMCFAGNLFTHYRYGMADVEARREDGVLAIHARTADGKGDLDLRAGMAEEPALPAGSVFPDLRTARRFAGPMPFTFSYEAKSRALVRIEGKRKEWHPRLVPVEIGRLAFLETLGGPARLASAFVVENVSYEWARGIVEPLRFGGREP